MAEPESKLESYPEYLARKAAEAAEPATVAKKAKAVEDKAVKAEDDEGK